MADTVTEDLHLDDVYASETAPTEAQPATDERAPARDDQGRFAAKQEAAPEAKAATPQPEAQPEPEATTRHVPLKELQSERTKRQEEARLRTEAEARAAVYERQLQTLMQQQRQPAAQPKPVQPPDPYTDPEGFTKFHVSQVQAQMEERILHISEANARRAHGDAIVNEALEMARRAGDPSYFSRFPDPWDALVEWGKRQKSLAKIGPDPDAYEKQVEERATAKILADLKAGKIKLDGTTVQPTRFPGTLAEQTSAGGSQTAHLSDEAIMAGAYRRA